MENKFEFRELCADDMFPMLALLNKIGFKEVKNSFKEINIESFFEDGEADVTAIGMDVFFTIASIIIENLPKCNNEIYMILANVSEKEISEIRKMPFADFAEMLIEFVKKPEFMDFFKVVSKLFK